MDTLTIYTNPKTIVSTEIVDDSIRVDNNPYRLKSKGEKGYHTKTITTTIPGRVIVSHSCQDNTIGKTLRYANSIGIDLTNADLRGVDISNEIFSHLSLNWANFDGANLEGVIFHNSYLNRAKFINVKAKGSIFYNVMMDTSDFYNSDFSCGDIILCQADALSSFIKTDFTGANHFAFRHRGALTSGWKVGKTGKGHEWKGSIFDWKVVWPTKEEAKESKLKLQALILQDLKWKCYSWLLNDGRRYVH
jgi:hypothetical protein